MAPDRRFTFQLLDDPYSRQAGLELQAQRYFDMGYIEDAPSAANLMDEYVEISTYFGAHNAQDELVAVGRLIPYTRELSIPSLKHFDLFDSGRKWVETVDLNTVAEFSALAIQPQSDVGLTVSRGLYRAMLQHSLAVSGRVNWCASIASRVLRLLRRVLDLQSVPLAEETHYVGAPTVPILIDVVNQMRHYAMKDVKARDFFLDGLEIDLDTGIASISNRLSAHVPSKASSSQRSVAS